MAQKKPATKLSAPVAQDLDFEPDADFIADADFAPDDGFTTSSNQPPDFSNVESGASMAHTTGVLPAIRRGASNFASGIINLPRAIINDSPIMPLLKLAGGDTDVENELLTGADQFGAGLEDVSERPFNAALRSIPGVGPDAANFVQRAPSDPLGAVAEAATTGALGYGTGRALGGVLQGSQDLATGTRRAGRTAGKFYDAPNIEAPEIVFQRATNLPPALIPDALDLATEQAQRTGQAVRNPSQMIQAANVDDVLLDNYKETFMRPQLDLVAPDAHLDIYRRKVAAVPESLRREDFDLYTKTMRRLQREFENGPLTVRQLENDRAYLANKGRIGSGSIAENTLEELIDNAGANAVRDNLYDFLDSRGHNHGSILREIHARKSTNKLIRDNMELLIPKSTLEAGKSRMTMLREIPGQIASATGITGKSAGPAMEINEAMFDAVQRWTPRRGPLPTSPYQPFNTAPAAAPAGPPPPLVGSYGRSRVPSLAPGVTLPGTDPVTGLRTVPPPLVNPTVIPKPRPPK